MKGWTKVIVLGLGKIPCKVAALFVVPFLDKEQRKNHSVFGVRDAVDLSWTNIAFRNGCHNMYNRPTPKFETRSNTEDTTLEQLEGFQWRYRQSTGDGEYVSFRMTWGKPNQSKGKNEFYVGWTMNNKPYMRLTFFQLRPAWFILIPVAIVYGIVKLFGL